MNLREQFDAKGVYVFVMTPFLTRSDARGRHAVDLVGVERNVAAFAHVHGDRTMVLCGGSGEIDSLDLGEIVDVAAAGVAGAAGRCQVICGVRGTNAQATKTGRRIQDVGRRAACHASRTRRSSG